MLIREFLEDNEKKGLGPWALKSSNSKGREFPEDKHLLRTDYQRDRDRIIYSTAFRRLEAKTQVFANHEGDNFRTRLTHTIEVANLSRTLARALHLNEDFSECLALVHDIGHPPFGHCGEEVLNELMENYGGFEHNEQTYRLVTILEKSNDQFSGLNLTKEVLEAILQHTKQYKKRYPNSKTAYLETQLVSLTDEMAYDAHDLEDGLSSGLLDENEVLELSIMENLIENSEFKRLKDKALRKKMLLRHVLNSMVVDFTEQSDKVLNEKQYKTPEEARDAEQSPLRFSFKIAEQKTELEVFLKERMYLHPTVRKMMHKASDFMHQLFKHFKKFPEELPLEYQSHFKKFGKERVITDYLSSMTDRSLQEEYTKLFMPFQKML